MRKLFSLLALLLCFAIPAWTATTTSTTLSGNITSSQTTIVVTSATGFTAGSTFALIGKEQMEVNGVSGTTITVRRGSGGTVAQAHNSGEIIYVGPTTAFVAWPQDPSGRCTSTDYPYLPLLNTNTGSLINCSNSRFTPAARVAGLESVIDTQPITLNSRNYNTANSNIGFQVKPAQNIANTNYIIGGEISPRCNNTFACAGVIGLHVDAYLRGTAAGTISGDVRGLQIEMVTDDAGTRTVSGNVSALRIRSAFSATTISGKFVPIRIEFPEAQTNSKTYDAVLELTGTVSGVWDDSDTDSGDSEAGYIKILVNGQSRYLVLYSDAP